MGTRLARPVATDMSVLSFRSGAGQGPGPPGRQAARGCGRPRPGAGSGIDRGYGRTWQRGLVAPYEGKTAGGGAYHHAGNIVAMVLSHGANGSKLNESLSYPYIRLQQPETKTPRKKSKVTAGCF